MNSEHAEAEQLFESTTIGETPARVVASPVRFSDIPNGTISSPPELGQDSASVLADFGLSAGIEKELT